MAWKISPYIPLTAPSPLASDVSIIYKKLGGNFQDKDNGILTGHILNAFTKRKEKKKDINYFFNGSRYQSLLRRNDIGLVMPLLKYKHINERKKIARQSSTKAFSLQLENSCFGVMVESWKGARKSSMETFRRSPIKTNQNRV